MAVAIIVQRIAEEAVAVEAVAVEAQALVALTPLAKLLTLSQAPHSSQPVARAGTANSATTGAQKGP